VVTLIVSCGFWGFVQKWRVFSHQAFDQFFDALHLGMQTATLSEDGCEHCEAHVLQTCSAKALAGPLFVLAG
jgi:hypothetical protein